MDLNSLLLHVWDAWGGPCINLRLGLQVSQLHVVKFNFFFHINWQDLQVYQVLDMSTGSR